MEEGQERQKFVTLSIRTTCWLQVSGLRSFYHHRISNDIPVRKHDAFRMSSSPGRVHKECQILCWILRLGAAVLCRACGIDDTGEVLYPVTRISLVSHDNDLVQGDANFLRRFLCIFDEWQLGNYGSGSGVFELESKFLNCIVRVRRREDTSSPVASPCDSRSVNAIWCVQRKDIALLPVPEVLQSFAKVCCSLLDLRICV